MAQAVGTLAAGVVSLAWCLLAVRLGPRIGYVDTPDGSVLKGHDRPAVPLGGVGVFLGIHVGSLIADVFDVVLLAGTGVVLVLGMIDDRIGLPPLLRLFVETVAGAIVVLGVYSTDADPVLLVAGIVLVVFAINAVNLFDGLDGLAGSVGIVSALGLAALSSGDVAVFLAAALIGFLVLNWHPARVFLGDGGAYVLGLTLAYLMLETSPGVAGLLVAAGMLGVFALDLVVTLVRRVLESQPLFEGDRGHVYDRLRNGGMTVPVIALLAAAAQTVIVVAVLAVDRWLA